MRCIGRGCARNCLGGELAARGPHIDDAMLSRLIWMAFDGFVINRRLAEARDVEAIASLIATLVVEAALAARAPRAGAGVGAAA